MTLSCSTQQSKIQQLKLDRLEQKIGCAFLTARGSYLSAMHNYAEVLVTELQTKPSYLLKECFLAQQEILGLSTGLM